MDQSRNDLDNDSTQREIVGSLLQMGTPEAIRMAKIIIKQGDDTAALERNQTGDARLLLQAMSMLERLQTEKLDTDNPSRGR